MGKQGGLKIGGSSVPGDILPLKHDYESVVVTDSISKIPLVLRVNSSYLLFWGFSICFGVYDDL